MGRSIVNNEKEPLTYEDLCDRCSMFKDEFRWNSLFEEDSTDDQEYDTNTKSYSIDDKKNSLRECIGIMLKDLWKNINSNFAHKDIHIICNDKIDTWNEVIASIRINNELLELKLTNEYMPDYDIDVNNIFITVFVNGKGVFTEWIENVNEEYEFAGSSTVVNSENELYTKNLEREKFIDKVIREINKLL